MTAVDELAGDQVTVPDNPLVEIERAVIGGCVQDRAVTEEVAMVLTPDSWIHAAHHHIFNAACELAEAGGVVTPAAVLSQLMKGGTLAKAGSGAYLHTCMRACPLPVDAVALARDLAEAEACRKIARLGVRLQQAGFHGPGAGAMTSEGWVEVAMRELHAIATGRAAPELPTTSDMLADVIDRLEHPESVRAVELPYRDLQALLGGLKDGRLYVIGARPAIGKTSLALDVIRHACVRCGVPGLMFSLEMSATENMTRILSAESRVPLHLLENPHTATIPEADWERIARACERIEPAPLFVDDTPNVTRNHIRLRATRLISRGVGLRFIIVDYLQLMAMVRADNREQQVSGTMRGLKLLARELNIPVVVLAQLNRGPENRSDHRPVLSDFRESGSVEQDADVVILLHREDAYNRETPRAGEEDLIVAKHRQGPTATVTIAFQGHYGRGVDMAPSVPGQRERPRGSDIPWTPHKVLGATGDGRRPEPLRKDHQ